MPDANRERGASALSLRVMRRLAPLCLAAAAAGGLAIFIVACIVSLSVALRFLGFGGIQGDFEIVEIGCVLAAFLFMPHCQLTRGHVAVDLFSNGLPARARLGLEGMWQVLFALGWLYLAWRLLFGALDAHEYGDRTMLLRFPLWWVWLPAILGSVLSALAALALGGALLSGRSPDRTPEGA